MPSNISITSSQKSVSIASTQKNYIVEYKHYNTLGTAEFYGYNDEDYYGFNTSPYGFVGHSKVEGNIHVE